MTRTERRIRNELMAWERSRGATIREIARRHGLSKSRVHQIVADVEILPPPPRPAYELVQSETGALTPVITYQPGHQRAYKVRNGHRVYAVGR